jgi:plasmid maintenance system antidote protein VapI
MRKDRNYRSLLRAAVALAGSERALAERLHVRESTVKRWLSGNTPITEAVFLKVVDLLEELRHPKKK